MRVIRILSTRQIMMPLRRTISIHVPRRITGSWQHLQKQAAGIDISLSPEQEPVSEIVESIIILLKPEIEQESTLPFRTQRLAIDALSRAHLVVCAHLQNDRDLREGMGEFVGVCYACARDQNSIDHHLCELVVVVSPFARRRGIGTIREFLLCSCLCWGASLRVCWMMGLVDLQDVEGSLWEHAWLQT